MRAAEGTLKQEMETLRRAARGVVVGGGGGEGAPDFLKNVVIKYMENPEQQHKVRYRPFPLTLLLRLPPYLPPSLYSSSSFRNYYFKYFVIVIFYYLSSQHLLPVLAKLLQFTDNDVERVREYPKKSGLGWW